MFALTYTIENYSFVVQGKTSESALSQFVGDPGDSFSTEEDLRLFLEDLEQQLMNKRVFHSVEHTYEFRPAGTDAFAVDVTFYVVDAKTFIILPYPKYDSNYGLSLKLKAKDTNLKGSFATLNSSLSYTYQNSFKESSGSWDFSIDDMRIKNAKVSVEHTGGLDLQDWTSSYLTVGAKISEIELSNSEVDGSVEFEMAPLDDSLSSAWGPHSLESSIGISFMAPKLNNFRISNSILYSFDINLFTTTTAFSYKLDDKLKATSVSEVYTEQNGFHKGWLYLRVGSGLMRSFSLFEKALFSPSIMAYIGYNFETYLIDPYFTISLPLSYGRIDWVENNFRKGFEFSLTASDTYHLLFNEDRFHYISLSGSADFHYPLTSWFNPAAKILFSLSSYGVEINADLSYSWSLRGIRDNNALMDEEIARKFGMVLNFDFMFNFITLKNFCHTYVNPFVDVFIGSNGDGFDRLVTVGGEGIVVIDNLPSYPIRGSLGINAEDLVKFCKGEIDLGEVEYEIFIGLYFLY